MQPRVQQPKQPKQAPLTSWHLQLADFAALAVYESLDIVHQLASAGIERGHALKGALRMLAE